jgi:hypothetical protein
VLEELGNFLGPDGVKARTWQRKLKAVQSELAAAQKANFALCGGAWLGWVCERLNVLCVGAWSVSLLGCCACSRMVVM